MPARLTQDTCYAPGCDNPREALSGGRGRIRWCSMHRYRMQKHGSLDKPERAVGAASPFWKGDAVGYAAAHDRVRAARGKPGACVVCRAGGAHWAYDHQDPSGLVGQDRGQSMPYSPDPDHYVALCVPCHRRFDARHLEVVP